MERTLQYATHSGYGNQMQALLTAVFIANVTNRVLLVPPLLPHDFIQIDGTRHCQNDGGMQRQAHILSMQKKIVKPHAWQRFDNIFHIPVTHDVMKQPCNTPHHVVKQITCELTDCANATSLLRRVEDDNLCLGALNHYHSRLLNICSQDNVPLAKELYKYGLSPIKTQPMRVCECSYERLPDTLDTPGRMTNMSCPFHCINDVWKDQMCCASCNKIISESNRTFRSSFWQQIQRLHLNLKRAYGANALNQEPAE